MPSQQQVSTTRYDSRDEWRTPKYLFRSLDGTYHFDIDLAAKPDNALCQNFIGVNSLGQDWHRLGCTGFLNPPYSNIDPFLKKAIDETYKGFTTVALIPTPNGEIRYGRYVFGVATQVTFITGRISFLTPNGRPVSGNTRGSMVVVYERYKLAMPSEHGTIYTHKYRDEIEKLYSTLAC